MREAFPCPDREALVSLWQKFYPERYWIDGDLIEQITTRHPLFDWGASGLDMDPNGGLHGFLAIKRSPNPVLFPGPNEDVAHITAMAYLDPVAAVDMLAAAKMILKNRGVAKLYFGGDCGHVFPGCPAECANLRSLLTVEGFQAESDAYDVERNLSDYEVPAWLADTLGRPDLEIRRGTEDDRDDLRRLLTAEFPGRWTHDTMEKCEAESEDGQIILLRVEGRLEGFAVTQTSASKQPRAGAVWRYDLGPDWCALGPIGVSRAVRGQRLGHALLAASLIELKKAGGQRCIIDWTTLLDFYGGHGFETSRTYTRYALDLTGPLRA